MEFLDKIVLHQSAHHMILIKYLLVLTHLLFIGYTSVLLGSLIYSIYFKRRYEKTSEKLFYNASKIFIDLATFHKGATFTFTIVTLLSAMFGYSQLLHLSKVNISLYLLISVIFLFISLIFIYSYKYSIHLKDIFEFADKSKVNSESLKNEIENYKSKTTSLYYKYGNYGLIFLLVSIYFYSAASQIAIDLTNWNDDRNIFYELFSLNSLLFFIQFINISFLITSIVISYKYFRNNAEYNLEDNNLKDFIKSYSLKNILAFSIILPLVVILNSFSKPVLSLSFNYFYLTVIALLLILFIASFAYLMIKENNLKFLTSILFLAFATLLIFIIKEQYTFDTATKSHFAYLSNEYDTYELKLKESAGLVSVKISGEDIFNGKCIACHNFDKKIVGPAYNDVLPKYEGKKDELVKFILNPVKVNPEYPSMPSQGLKPNEAEAIADYILATYKKK